MTKNRTKTRGARGRWQKGHSGNLNGRPPLSADYKTALRQLEPLAMEGLRGILLNPGHPRHEQACEYVVNRLYGMPSVKAEISGPGGGPMRLAGDEDPITTMLKAMIAKRAAAASEGGG